MDEQTKAAEHEMTAAEHTTAVEQVIAELDAEEARGAVPDAAWLAQRVKVLAQAFRAQQRPAAAHEAAHESGFAARFAPKPEAAPAPATPPQAGKGRS